MFGFFKKKKKKLDENELVKRAKENDKDAQYQLSLEYYRGTSLAQDKEKSRYWLEKASGADNQDV
ncbi:SEL1-like repeat protein [Sulfurovum sp.]|uniref:SEL1-like repeat protein n=1 Tax=Sulfurovum sp. TaxID=1969726 RepID=UPI002867EB8B|nr:SEL1-like repeat protein [Sulfurovum sp.]